MLRIDCVLVGDREKTDGVRQYPIALRYNANSFLTTKHSFPFSDGLFKVAVSLRNHEKWTNLIALPNPQKRSRSTTSVVSVSKLAAAAYEDNHAQGAFILIDEATNHTVAAGMIRKVSEANSFEI